MVGNTKSENRDLQWIHFAEKPKAKGANLLRNFRGVGLLLLLEDSSSHLGLKTGFPEIHLMNKTILIKKRQKPPVT